MSTESVQDIIGKAVTESEYRELLFADPEKALEGYDLTEEEIVALKEIKAENFDELMTDVEERISRAGVTFNAAKAVTHSPSQPREIFNEVVRNNFLKK